jgi:hypothetical protein
MLDGKFASKLEFVKDKNFSKIKGSWLWKLVRIQLMF